LCMHMLHMDMHMLMRMHNNMYMCM